MQSSDYLDILKEQVENGKEASMIITGNSMAPFLYHGRDVIYFSRPVRPPKRGDMVFYQRKNGQYVMHRLIRVSKSGCFFLGDNQTIPEGPLLHECIFAIVTRVKRKNRMLDSKSFWWFFFSHIWISIIPLRHPMMSVYRIFFTRRLR